MKRLINCLKNAGLFLCIFILPGMLLSLLPEEGIPMSWPKAFICLIIASLIAGLITRLIETLK